MDWCKEKRCQSYTEDVLMVTKMRHQVFRHNIQCTLDIKNGVDISKYSKFRVFLKRQSEGCQPKKSKVFTKEQVVHFLNAASDDEGKPSQKYVIQKNKILKIY